MGTGRHLVEQIEQLVKRLSRQQSSLLARPFQLQEYQTDVGRCRFDTLGKLTPAHRAGPPTAHGLWVCTARWVSAFLTAAGPPTVRGTFYCP